MPKNPQKWNVDAKDTRRMHAMQKMPPMSSRRKTRNAEQRQETERIVTG